MPMQDFEYCLKELLPRGLLSHWQVYRIVAFETWWWRCLCLKVLPSQYGLLFVFVHVVSDWDLMAEISLPHLYVLSSLCSFELFFLVCWVTRCLLAEFALFSCYSCTCYFTLKPFLGVAVWLVWAFCSLSIYIINCSQGKKIDNFVLVVLSPS